MRRLHRLLVHVCFALQLAAKSISELFFSSSGGAVVSTVATAVQVGTHGQVASRQDWTSKMADSTLADDLIQTSWSSAGLAVS